MSSSPGITLTPEETRLFGNLFKQYDNEGTGIVLGDAARPLFERSGLNAKTLGQIWSQADTENRGFLDYQGFAKALRMISHVQNGQQLSSRLITIPSSLPDFSGAAANQVKSPTVPQSTGFGASGANAAPGPATGTAAADSNSTGTGAPIPALTESDQQRFNVLFDRSANNGLLDGAAAKEIFIKAQLPTDVLGRIWNLVDVHGRGALTRNEFLLAMHLIQSTISRSLPSVPSSLPSSWIAWLDSSPAPQGRQSGPGQDAAAVNSARGSVDASRRVSLREALPANSTGGSFGAGAVSGNNWIVTNQQKQQYDQYFDQLDTQRKGVIGAQEVVPFLTKSRLSEEVLAQVWDLADIEGQGNLGRTEFALAMFFVQAKLAGAELPDTLPSQLLESARRPEPKAQAESAVPTRSFTSPPPAGAGAPAPPAQRQAAQTSAPSTLRQQDTASSLTDLATLDDSFFRAKPQSQAADTGSAQQSRNVSLTGAGTGTAPAAVEEKSREAVFVPVSSFGQTLLSNSNQQQPTVELQQAKSEVADLTKQAEDLRSQQAQLAQQNVLLEEELTAVQSKKRSLEAEIRGLRERYDAEATKVHKAQGQLKAVQDEIRQLEKSHTLRESGLKALQSQHDEHKQTLDGHRKRKEELEANVSGLEKQHSELEEQHLTHKQNLESVRSETEHLRGQADHHQQQIASFEAELRGIYEQIEKSKSLRDEHARRTREAKERTDHLASEVVTAQQEHNAIVAEAERHAAEAEAAAQREAAQREEHVRATEARDAAARDAQAQGSAAPRSVPGGVTAGAVGGAAVGSALAAASALARGQASTTQVAASAPSQSQSQYGANSPGSTKQNSTVYSPHSSPPTSAEFPAGYSEPQQIPPTFTLPMARPESATSSVANNPPQSVRGDADADVSQPASPTFLASEPVSEPVSGLVPPENLKLPPTGQANAEVPATASDNDSFEFVDAYDGFETGRSRGTPGVPGAAAANAPLSRTQQEFPPIRDLEIDESDSEDEQHVGRSVGGASADGAAGAGGLSEPVHAVTASGETVPVDTTSVPPHVASGHSLDPGHASEWSTRGAQGQNGTIGGASAFSGGAPRDAVFGSQQLNAARGKDDFGDAFDDLQEAQEDNFDSGDEEEEFSGFGNAIEGPARQLGGGANPAAQQAAAAEPSGAYNGPDEWQELFSGGPGSGSAGVSEGNSSSFPGAGEAEGKALAELTAIGFDRDAALAALKRSNFNVTDATNLLLDS